MIRRPPSSPLFPYTPLSRSGRPRRRAVATAPVALRDGLLVEHRPRGRAARAGEGDRFRQLDSRRDVADRKSTRLNSSHDQISYAVFCLKKKKAIGPTVVVS